MATPKKTKKPVKAKKPAGKARVETKRAATPPAKTKAPVPPVIPQSCQETRAGTVTSATAAPSPPVPSATKPHA